MGYGVDLGSSGIKVVSVKRTLGGYKVIGAGRKRIPKGAAIAFEMHYTPNGTACADRSSVGLIYASAKPRHQVLSGAVMQLAILIPPGASSARRTDSPRPFIMMVTPGGAA